MTPRTIKYSVVFVFSLAMPLIASAVFNFETFGPNYLFLRAGKFISYTIDLLLGVATLVFFWGVIQYVIAQGDETKLKAGRKYMVWGIIGLVVIASAWGMANLIIFTIFGQTSFSIPLFGFSFGGGAEENALTKCPICLKDTPGFNQLACDACLFKESFGL